MADKPTGPVKPPVLDLKARPAQPETEKSATTKQSTPIEPTKPVGASASVSQSAEPQKTGEQPKPSSTAQNNSDTQRTQSKPAALPVAPLAITGLAGAALGLSAAYGLATAGLWPQSQSASLSSLESRLTRIESTAQTNSGEMETLAQRLGAIEGRPAPELPALPDNIVTGEALSEISAQIDALGLRIDVVAAGIPADESAQLADEIARLGSGLAALEQRMATPDRAVEAISDDLATILGRLETLEAQSANQATLDAMRIERDRFAALPAATAALQAAITSGNPFATELAAIEALVPELGITNPVRSIAASGAKPLRIIAGEFRALIPTLLAARPHGPDTPWFAALIDQASSAVALRPVDDGADTPQAIVGRIETALESDDAIGARALILSLPEVMQAAAASIRSDLDAVIAARALLADIRAMAPQSSGGAAQ